ncbi:MAG: phosphoenolpyruvate synthase/pyruvate phosphate dikinase, partial [Desulfopila sp.]|nr:phosphoenolpyruvate synthase/pyruvate phosphate dikinase [Desulfopila sp.]
MAEKGVRKYNDFDPHFKIFHRLMSYKIQNILLVSSAYDAFIMEEDGSIATQVIKEYQGLSLSGAPLITRVSSVSEALAEIRRRKYDLVITMPFLRGINAFEIGSEIKKINPALP